MPARRCRQRRLRAATAAVGVILISSSIPGAAASTAARAPGPCATPGRGWCVARRFAGSVPRGELGFRFGEPRDVDGDGLADVAAGARFTLQRKVLQNGSAAVWSGASGRLVRAWDGELPDGLFGHWVLPVADVSADGLADVVVAAPHGPVDGRVRGVLVALSPKTGERLWERAGPEREDDNFGWDLAPAADRDGDGHDDLFVGAPSQDTGRVYLLSGRTGTVLGTYAPPRPAGSFGWYVAEVDDLDADGRRDLAVGGPLAANPDGAMVGAAWVLSSASGRVLHHWTGTDRRGGFGGIVAAVADVDGDGRREIAVAAPGTEDLAREVPGEVRLFASASGREVRRWSGTQPGELYGRMVVATGDLDGDGVDDVAVGAPWHRRERADRIGRVELRSGRDGALLSELAGDDADGWFGWHVRRAPDPDRRGRPALLIGSLRRPVDGNVGVGAVDLVVWRHERDGGDHGTITRGSRRSDIR